MEAGTMVLEAKRKLFLAISSCWELEQHIVIAGEIHSQESESTHTTSTIGIATHVHVCTGARMTI